MTKTFEDVFNKVQDEYDAKGAFLENGEEALLRAYAEAFCRLKDIEPNLNPDESDEDGYTILMNLSLTGRIDLVQKLVELGANVNALSNDRDYALALAARSGWKEIFDYLAGLTAPALREEAEKELPKGLIYRQRKNNKSIAELMKAAWDGDQNALEKIIQNGIDINGFSPEGDTALHKACRSQKLSAVKFLLQNGANPNVREEEWGETPIFYSIKNKNSEIVQILIDNGANLNLNNYIGYTPLMLSINPIYHAKLNQKILNANPDLNLPDYSGNTALMYAAYLSDLTPILLAGLSVLNIPSCELFTTVVQIEAKFLQKILNRGLEWSESSFKDYEALKKITQYWNRLDPKINAKLIVELLKRGAEPSGFDRVLLLQGVMIEDENRVQGLVNAGVDLKSVFGTTPLIEATRKENIGIVKILLLAGVDVNERNAEGNTALIEAARLAHLESYKMPEIVKLLLKAGADVNAKNKDGYRPLTYARYLGKNNYNEVCELGHPEIQRLLQNAGAID